MSSPLHRAEGKISVVTGAAQGIGEAIARKLAAHGATVIVADIQRDKGTAVARELPGAVYRQLDVTSVESWQGLVGEVIQRFDRLDVLVNNAGIGTGGGIERETLEDHRRVIEVNLTGVWSGIRSAVKPMRDQGGGSIINISSIDGLAGVSGLSTYVASKFAVTGMTRTLALELGAWGIRVNSVHPGIIGTEKLLESTGTMRERLDKAIARQPIQRMGTPEEVANAVLYFASDESSYCTGSTLLVDGGHLAGPYRDSLT